MSHPEMKPMTRDEQNARITARLYDCRRAARGLLGDAYDETLAPYRAFIQRVMKQKNLPVLRAVLDILRHVPELDAVPLMMTMAAAVELIESPGAER